MIRRAGRPSRVLMTADTVGGVWTYALELAGALSQAGVEVGLATMGGRSTEQQRKQAKEIQGLELFESCYRLPWMEHPWEDVRRAGDWLLEIGSRIQPDLVHLNEPVFGSLQWPVPKVAVAHSCVLSWWEAVEGRAAPAEWTVYQRQMARGLNGADLVIAPSHWMLQRAGRLYGVKRGRVISNGRNARKLYPEAKEPVIFAAGRLWDRAKNLALLEEVAREVAWPVHIAGEASDPDGKHQVSVNHATLLGQLPADTVAAWLRKSSIYAFPARYEPFGLSVLEAALAGCALVLGDLPTLRELWDGAAVFVSPDSQDDLRLALNGLIEEPLLRQALAMRARRRALRFSPHRMAQAYLDAYASLLSGSGSYAQEPVCAS